MNNFFDKYSDIFKRYEQSLKNFAVQRGWKYPTTDEKENERIKNEYDNQVKEEMRKAEIENKKKQEEANKQQRINFALQNYKTITPPRYIEANIGDFHPNADVQALIKGKNGILLGSIGSGKTRLAYAMAKEWALNGETCKIEKAFILLSKIKSSQDPFNYIFNNYIKDKHLVIDEIDKIFQSKADLIYLNSIIDDRYNNLNQTILIGNSAFQTKDEAQNEIIQNLGMSIYSRLCGTAEGNKFIYVNSSNDRRFTK